MFALLASKSPESRDVAKKLTLEHDGVQRTGQDLLELLDELSTDDQSRESYENLAHGLKDFADNMRAHLREEERLLYSAAWKMFTDDDWETISFQEPGEDPLSDNGHSEYPLLADYVSGNHKQSRVILLGENMNKRLKRAFSHAKSCAGHVMGKRKLARDQRKEAWELTVKSISAMPLLPLLSPRKTWVQGRR